MKLKRLLTLAIALCLVFSLVQLPVMAAKDPSADFEYEIKNAKVTITKYIGSATDVEIPELILSDHKPYIAYLDLQDEVKG